MPVTHIKHQRHNACAPDGLDQAKGNGLGQKKAIKSHKTKTRSKSNRVNTIKLGALASPRHRPSQPSKLPPQPQPGLRRRLRLRRGRRRRLPDNRHRSPPRPGASSRAAVVPVPLLISRAVNQTELVGEKVVDVAAVTAAAHALQPAGPFLHGAELFEELAPSDDAFFSAFEAVGAVKGGEVGGCCVAGRVELVSFATARGWGEIWAPEEKRKGTHGLGAICR